MNLRKKALEIRRTLLNMHYMAKAGHIGTGLSAIDLLTYIYGSWLRPQDQFILSKGHGASSLYATLNNFNLLTTAELATYYQEGTLFPAHPAPRAHPCIPVATGSLGHGLPIAAGIAFANKHIHRNDKRVACILSDGDCNEGSVWEAAMFAAHHGLSNLVMVVDANGLQGFGKSTDVLNMEPFAGKWKAFGFDVREINGHDFTAMEAAFLPSDKPVCVLARTIKGKGISFMENKIEWHYLPMNESQFNAAIAELNTISEAA